jgi:PAS domain S-box-containing protein
MQIDNPTPSLVGSLAARLLPIIDDYLPRGLPISDEAWNGRHRFLVYLLWTHAFGVPAFAIWMNGSVTQCLAMGASLAVCTGLARENVLGRSVQSLLVSFGLMSAAAWIVYASGGYIEMHFHYFVLIPFLALYQSWPPFLLAVGYVALQHGVSGMFWPQHVYNHSEAWAHPWQWGMIHAGFLSLLCTGIFALWRAHEMATQCTEALLREKSQILANADAFFIGVNADLMVSEWTDKTEQLFGLSSKDAIGKPLRVLSMRWKWDDVLAALNETSEKHKTIELEKIRLSTPGQKESFVKLKISPLHDSRGVGFVLMGEDITEKLVFEHEMRQSQKLQSIGHLAAGIAHEINTPTQFVGDNLRFHSDSFHDITAVLGRHQAVLRSVKAGSCSPNLIAACEEESRRVDIDFLLEEIPKAIDQSTEGITRVASIVRAMKEFSHPGNDDKVCVDLNKAIESTVTVASHEWKYVADLTTDLAPSLPPVPCLVSQFNQVVLNMIVNATHAIADVTKGTGAKGTISITTRAVDGWVEIRIADSGAGIPEEIRTKIFDPFFTTKEVGKGTGQGLAIAHSVIVDKHQGTITLESVMGRGTTFIVRLPLAADTTTAATKMAA